MKLGDLIKNTPHLFMGICIFASAYLILAQLEENGSK